MRFGKGPGLDPQILKALGVVPPFSGKKYGAYPGAPGNGAIANGALIRVCFAPVPIFYTVTFATANIDVRTGGTSGARCRFGVWESDVNGRPGKLLLDSGQINIETTGDKSVAFTATLQPGLYWVGGCYQGVASGSLQFLPQSWLLSLIGGISNDVEATPSFIHDGVSGALPSYTSGFIGSMGGSAEIPPAVTLIAA